MRTRHGAAREIASPSEHEAKCAQTGESAIAPIQTPAVFRSTGLKYGLAEKSQAIVSGGVPLMLRVARASGLIDAIDSGVPILKCRCPYDESDHVAEWLKPAEASRKLARHKSRVPVRTPRPAR